MNRRGRDLGDLSGQFATSYLETIKPETGLLVTLLDWLREAWIVRRYSDLDRMLRQNIPSSNRTSLTAREIYTPRTLGSPGRAQTPSSMESGSLGRVLQSCRGDTVRLLRHHISRCENILHVTCRLRDSH